MDPILIHTSDANHPPENSVLQKTNGVDEQPLKITITLPTHAYFISSIRDFTKSMVQNMTGFTEQWAFRFQSVVDELCNNAIEFGSRPGENITVTFVSTKGKCLEIFVKDTGTGVARKTASEMQKTVEERKKMDPTKMGIRGRGLAQIVSNWTDMLEFKDNEGGGLTVHVTKNVDKEN
ncbi:ATP-binding protein [Candidatus Peregrinibacteria bacterium]|nr:ATP-binding protein [Candidatus Peregrinibacteria bacterium]